MKRVALLLAVVCGVVSQWANATSTLSFTGGDFEVQVVISDTNDSLSNLRIYEGDRLVFDAATELLNTARFDPKKQAITLNVSSQGRAPKIVLRVRGTSGTLTLGTKRVRLSGDWLR
jgi:hypothetical protein